MVVLSVRKDREEGEVKPLIELEWSYNTHSTMFGFQESSVAMMKKRKGLVMSSPAPCTVESIRLLKKLLEKNEKRLASEYVERLTMENDRVEGWRYSIVQPVRSDVLKEGERCSVCGKKGKLQKCARCTAVSYCGRDCQVKDWKERGHKDVCKKKETVFSGSSGGDDGEYVVVDLDSAEAKLPGGQVYTKYSFTSSAPMGQDQVKLSKKEKNGQTFIVKVQSPGDSPFNEMVCILQSRISHI